MRHGLGEPAFRYRLGVGTLCCLQSFIQSQYPLHATRKRKMVSTPNSGGPLSKRSGIAKPFEMFSRIQFSILLLAKSHMPAHAVELIHASQAGTVEEVKRDRINYNTSHPPRTMATVIIHSCRPAKSTFTGGSFLFLIQCDHP